MHAYMYISHSSEDIVALYHAGSVERELPNEVCYMPRVHLGPRCTCRPFVAAFPSCVVKNNMSESLVGKDWTIIPGCFHTACTVHVQG